MHPWAICFCADVIYNVANRPLLWIEVSQCVRTVYLKNKKTTKKNPYKPTVNRSFLLWFHPADS